MLNYDRTPNPNRHPKEELWAWKKKIRSFSRQACGYFYWPALAACQSGLTSYQGKTVAAQNRFDLQQGGPHKGSWQTRDLLIEYQYLREQQNLQISGLVKPQTHILNFNILKYLFFSLHFVDAEGKVLVDEAIMSAGYRIAMPEQMAFKANLKIPPDSTAIAFSYRGSALSGGGQGECTGWDFWQGP